MKRPLGTILTLLAAAFVLAGCGGDGGADVAGTDVQLDTEALSDRAQAARDQVQEALRGVTGARSAEELSDALRQGAEGIRESAERLDETPAPTGADAAKQELTAAMTQLSLDMEEAAANVRTGDPAAAARDLLRTDAVGDVQAALQELQEQGVEVEGLDTGALGVDVEAQVQSAVEAIEDAVSGLGAMSSTDELADRMELAVRQLDEAAERLDGAAPDTEAQRALDELAAAMRDVSKELDAAAPQVREGDLAAALRQAAEIDLGQLREALDDVRAQGFDAPALGGS